MPGTPTVTIPDCGLTTRISGPTPSTRIVLLHGFTQTARSWDWITAALAATGHEVVAVDMPGHGRSGEIRANLEESADLVVAAAGPAVYVGYSMGGRVALHAACRFPTEVRGLVLIGATAGIDDRTERHERRLADEQLAADLESHGLEAFLTRWLSNPLFATLPSNRAGIEMRRGNSVAGLAASLRLCGTGTQEPLWEQVSSIGCPVSVLAGSLDAKFRAIGTRLASAIGPNATFGVIDAAGHAAHLERPQDVIDAIVSLVARVD